MQTLTTKFGRNLLVLDRYSFVKDKNGPLGKIYWKCIEFQRKQCRKRIPTKMVSLWKAQAILAIGIYSHPAEPEKIEVRKAMMKITKLAKSTTDSNQVIIADALASVDVEVQQHMAQIQSISRSIRHIRQQTDGLKILTQVITRVTENSK